MAFCVQLMLFICCFVFVSGKDLRASSDYEDDTKCGYGSCNPVVDGMINVHVVPHTHDDVGWLITVDQYYYKEVQYILDSVIPELIKDPKKRFIYVEVAFFARWWREQHDYMRHAVKKLVNEGRLEFILGGWCMNDEAATHYNAIIDQHTLGFEFLRENFGKCGKPRVGWQIDPFGHSREQASIFARFGFDSLFFGRLDYQDKDNREKHRTMEMIWRGSPDNLGKTADLFTGVLPNCYNPPKGFCFDIYCDDQIVDDHRLHDYNVKQSVDAFLLEMSQQANYYATNHLIVTMGSDFQYQAANNWYKNLDKLIKYVNARQANGSKVNLLYSTPSCYTYHVNKAGKTFTTKEDDFFPYAHRPHSFWTGYFTSRPTLKGYVRRTNNFLQTIKQLDALAILEDTDNSTYNINILSEAMGVAQHHDAVSGTEKQAVTFDYEERLANGVREGQKVYNDAMKKLGRGVIPDQSFCNLLNISMCPMIQKVKEFELTIYNPIAREGMYYVSLPVPENSSYVIKTPNGTVQGSEVFPIPPGEKRIPERKGATSGSELIFPVHLPPLGFGVYEVMLNKVARSTVQRKPLLQGNDVVIKNEYMSLTFDGTSGFLKSMSNLEKKISIAVNQTFLFYKGHNGDNGAPDLQASGAYVFRPTVQHPFSTIHTPKAKVTTKSYVVEGTLMQEVYQEFSPWLTQTVRLQAQKRHAEFRWTVGPIPVQDSVGKEVVSRFTTSLNNNKVFYTDANGREMIKRVVNHRDTWQFKNTEPVSGNYAPVNSRIYIRDEAKKTQFTVLTDRSQGGTSLNNGEVELMVHRRLLHDDGLGVGEALNETGCDNKGLIAQGSHYVMLEPLASAAAGHRDLGERLYMAPQLSFSLTRSKFLPGSKIWSGVQKALPDNVHLLTLQQYPSFGPSPTKTQPFLLRLEHFYEKGEDSVLSKPATVNLQSLFSTFEILEAKELTLGGDMVLSDLHRLKWNYPAADAETAPQESDLKFRSEKWEPSSYDNSLTVTLNPMEIKTWQITIKPISK